MPREILVEWTTPAGNEGRTVTLWENATAVADQRSALNTFLNVLNGSLDDHVSWRIATSGRELEDDSGYLSGVWAHATSYAATGAGSGEMIPDATQVLMRWDTSIIINHRFLRGRTYIPGMSTGGMVNGNVSSSIVSAWTTAGQAMITAGKGFGVWHRPVLGVGGEFHQATVATVWPELAVLRRRRG